MVDPKEEAKKVCYRVIERFPEIKEDLKVEYHQDIDIAGTSPDLVKDPKLFISDGFFSLDKEEQEAITAHEVGHFIHYNKNPKDPRINRIIKWRKILESHYTEGGRFAKMKEHRLKRLKKWYLMNEIFADKKAADAGYGHTLLDLLKRFHEEDHEDAMEINQYIMSARIANLENLLEK